MNQSLKYHLAENGELQPCTDPQIEQIDAPHAEKEVEEIGFAAWILLGGC